MQKSLFNIRMRAAQGGAHELGGKHISGGERITKQEDIQQSINQLLKKAQSHTRGEVDFIQITVEAIDAQEITRIMPQPVTEISKQSISEGLKAVKVELIKMGVSGLAIDKAITFIQFEPTHRGAIIMDAQSGKRLDENGLSGIRVSKIDWENNHEIHCSKTQRRREGRAIAAKVAHSPITVAELCCSDDPDYIIGYVSSKQKGYIRISPLKSVGDMCGGRVFFVNQPYNLKQYSDFLQSTPILISELGDSE